MDGETEFWDDEDPAEAILWSIRESEPPREVLVAEETEEPDPFGYFEREESVRSFSHTLVRYRAELEVAQLVESWAPSELIPPKALGDHFEDDLGRWIERNRGIKPIRIHEGVSFWDQSSEEDAALFERFLDEALIHIRRVVFGSAGRLLLVQHLRLNRAHLLEYHRLLEWERRHRKRWRREGVAW
jgi:DNA-binding GntR family transcriptional regulator